MQIPVETFSIVPGATIVEGVTHNGKKCRIIDNTHSVNRDDMERLLQELIEHKRFGVMLLTDAQNQASAGRAQVGHIQLGDSLFRLIVFPYQAIIEKF